MQNISIQDNKCNIPIEYFEKYLTNLTALDLDLETNICYESALEEIANEQEISTEDFLKSKSIYYLDFNVIFLNNYLLIEIVEFIFGRMKNLKKLSLPYVFYNQFHKVSLFENFDLNYFDKTFPLVSIECLKSFKSIERLKLGSLPPISLLQVSELLKSFTNLKELVIKYFPPIPLTGNKRNRLQLVLDNFSRLEYVKLYRIDEINCHQIQKKFPKVRFSWIIHLKIDSNQEFANGNYEGNFSYQNNREGRGVYFSKGTRYEGEWKNDKREGKGEMIYYNGNKYEGEWKNDERDGKGVMIFRDGGNKYEGEWKKDVINGIGVYNWNDSGQYEGEFVNGMREGRGTMTLYYHNEFRSKYEGEWKSDKKNGTGIYISVNSNKYEGEWVNDKKEGRGTKYYSLTGSKYEGEFVNGKREGRGTLFFSNGGKYEGEWKDDLQNGIGVCIWGDGKKYEGEWVDGDREGRGTMYYSDGSIYEGEWKNDEEW